MGLGIRVWDWGLGFGIGDERLGIGEYCWEVGDGKLRDWGVQYLPTVTSRSKVSVVQVDIRTRMLPEGLGFRVSDIGFRVSDIGFRV